MSYYFIKHDRLNQCEDAPNGAKPLKHNLRLLLPPLVSVLHTNFRAWNTLGYSPGPLLPKRVYYNAQGDLAFYFWDNEQPQPLRQVGCSPDLAAWLVLLDKWMETYVVIARARTVWQQQELASALTFLTPAYLPAQLVAHPPANWERVAYALATTLADGPITGVPTNRHWQ
ncbi:MAG: hypothetical protein R3C14_15095 [Caldilineaceae bacterium]